MGSKSSAPSSPDYSSTAAASEYAAQLEAQTSKDQLDWSKSEYNDIAPYTKAYLQSMTDVSNTSISEAKDQQSFYDQYYKPLEAQFATTAAGYNAPARAEQQSAAAQADVANSFAAQRQSSLQSLESYGIDPSQTRYGALDLGTRISQAAAQASAGTQSRLNTEATGLALQGEAINVGRGYSSAIAQSYNTAQSSGASGISAANQTYGTGSSSMGTGVQWGQLSNQSYGTSINAKNTQFNNELSAYNAENAVSSSEASGIGSLVGGLGMASILKFSDRALKTDIREIGETDRGIPIVTYRYKGEPKNALHVGVLAQDARKVVPEAVVRVPFPGRRHGALAVDYSRIR